MATHAMVIVDGVRYRAEDVERLGVLATGPAEAEPPTAEATAEGGDKDGDSPDVGEPDGPGDSARPKGRRPGATPRATKGK